MALVVPSPHVGWLRGERVRRQGWWGLAGSGLTALVSWAFMIPLDSSALFLLSIVAGLAAVASGVAIATADRVGGRRTAAVVRIADGELAIEGATPERIPLDQLEDGWIEHPAEVRFRTKDRRVLAIAAPDVATADALLAAAGTSASQRVLSVPLSSVASQAAGGVPLATTGVALLSPALLFLVAVISIGLPEVALAPSAANVIGLLLFTAATAVLGLGLAALVSTLRRREAVIGKDGVTLRQGRRTTFVPYAAMSGVEADARGVRLHRQHGGPVLLPTWSPGEAPLTGPGAGAGGGGSDGALRQRVLVDRIERAARASRRGSADLEVLDRRGRPIPEWREEVQALARAKSDYRSSALSTTDLADVVEDVAAAPERRIGAALALAGTDDPDARSRVRIAIETCADEDLRIALEHGAEAELEEEIVQRAVRRRM